MQTFHRGKEVLAFSECSTEDDPLVRDERGDEGIADGPAFGRAPAVPEGGEKVRSLAIFGPRHRQAEIVQFLFPGGPTVKSSVYVGPEVRIPKLPTIKVSRSRSTAALGSMFPGGGRGFRFYKPYPRSDVIISETSFLS